MEYHTQLKNKQTKCEISFRNAVEQVNYVQKFTIDAWCQNPHLPSNFCLNDASW